MDHKQVLILRTDLDMSQGKMIAQACHASLGSYEKCDKKVKEEWRKQGSKKVVVQSKSESRTLDLFEEMKAADIPCFLVKDRGLTEVERGTVTGLGAGPVLEEKVDKITEQLKTL